MIVETIMNVIIFMILGVIGVFPKIPALNLDFLNWVVRVFSLVDLFVSLRVVGVCLVVVLILKNAGIIWAIVMWVVRKIPSIK